jgi:hypothetical protein
MSRAEAQGRRACRVGLAPPEGVRKDRWGKPHPAILISAPPRLCASRSWLRPTAALGRQGAKQTVALHLPPPIGFVWRSCPPCQVAASKPALSPANRHPPLARVFPACPKQIGFVWRARPWVRSDAARRLAPSCSWELVLFVPQ